MKKRPRHCGNPLCHRTNAFGGCRCKCAACRKCSCYDAKSFMYVVFKDMPIIFTGKETKA